MIYFAAPYSTGFPPDISPEEKKRLMLERYNQINKCAAHLRRQGYMVYSPVTHGVPLEEYLPEHVVNDHEFWMAHCYIMLGKCDALFVCTLHGWEESDGVADEIERILNRGCPVYLVDPETCEVKRYA